MVVSVRRLSMPPLLRASILLLASLPAAAQSVAPSASATSPAAAQRGDFVDATEALGLRFTARASHTSRKYLIETMGSGVALLDYDNDGRLDIFCVNGAHLDDPTPAGTIPKKEGPVDWNRLYHQRPDGAFEDVTEKAGLAGAGYDMGAAVGDYDNDGYEDLYVTGYGGNHLYHNNGDGTFRDVTAASGTGGGGWSTSAAWLDLDNDGRLDLVVLRYMQWDFEDIYCGEHRPGYRAYCHPDVFPPIAPLVYHNEGAGRFTEQAAKTGLGKPGKGLGLAVADYDRDGRVDLAVANDSMLEFLYRNTGSGVFEESGLNSEMAVDGDGRTFAGMGIDFGDYDNDGLPDLVITDLANQKYALYRNNGDGSFTYDTYASGVGGITLLHSGWGVHFLDYDNDGWKDLLVTQGHDLDTIQLQFPQLRYKEPMLLLRNTGKGFLDVSKESGAVFRNDWAGRGLAAGDLDNDGNVDAVITTNDGAAHILMNRTRSGGHWLEVLLVGHRSNRDAIGAEISITTSRGRQMTTITTAGSYLSSSDRRAHFGLGPDALIPTVEIRWPSGIRQVLTHVKADQLLRIEEPDGAAR